MPFSENKEEGSEGVKWELRFAFLCSGKMRFTTLGLGFNHWEKGLTISKMGMGFLSFHDLRLCYLTKLLKCAYFLI